MGILSWFRRNRVAEAPPGRVRVRGIVDPVLYYETTDAAALAELATALETGETTGAHCMCPGTLRFELETNGKLQLATLHHGETLRWDDAFDNVPLRSPDAVMDWLSARGITFVREEYAADRLRAAESLRESARWRERMPASLAPFFDAIRSSGGREDPAWTAAIERELPDPVRRAAVLLELFGSGVGPWSGYPSYEAVPEQLLLQMPLPVLLAAIGDATTEAMREGATRLFCGWSFGKERKRDRARIPDALRSTLRAHLERSDDEHKRSSARSLEGS